MIDSFLQSYFPWWKTPFDPVWSLNDGRGLKGETRMSLGFPGEFVQDHPLDYQGCRKRPMAPVSPVLK